MSAPEEISFQASGMTFGALAWGPADGPLALCLHGYPDTAWTWRHLGPDLAERDWRVVAPFQRGYAPTMLAPDGCYQVGALIRDALAAHRALGDDRRAALIGHDWGALAAYGAGSFAPDTFAKIVTLAVPPPVLPSSMRSLEALIATAPLALRQLGHSWYTIFQQLPGISEQVLEALVAKLWADWSPAYDAGQDLAHVRAALPDKAHRTAALRYYRALLQPWYRSNEYAAEQAHMLRMSDGELLYLHGEDDGCLLPALAGRAAEALGPRGRFELIRGAGHFLQLERPELVNPAISDFIGPAG